VAAAALTDTSVSVARLLKSFDPNSRSVLGTYDFIGVAEHEFSEVMGRIALVGGSLGSSWNTYSALDLFRYAGFGARQLAAGQTACFSVDGGRTNLDYFNTISGGDWGDWAASAGSARGLIRAPSHH